MHKAVQLIVTTVKLVRAVGTVVVVITSQLLIDARPVTACELVWSAGTPRRHSRHSCNHNKARANSHFNLEYKLPANKDKTDLDCIISYHVHTCWTPPLASAMPCHTEATGDVIMETYYYGHQLILIKCRSM